MAFANNDGSDLVGGQLPSGTGQSLQLDGSGNLKVAGSFTGSSASTAATGAAVPAQATYIAGNKAGNLTGVSLDASGYLNVNVQAGGGSNASIGTNGAAIPGSSTQIGASDGTNLQQLLVESSTRRNLRTAIYNAANELGIDSNGVLTALLQVVSGTALVADQTNSILRTSLYGKNAVAADTALGLDSSGRVQDNIAQWAGAAPSVNNPVITEDQIRGWINNGQGFSGSTGKLTGVSGTLGLSIFNPNASGKTLIVYSISVIQGQTHFDQINYTTSDPALGTAVTAVNLKAGSGTASVTTCSSANTTVVPAGTLVDATGGLNAQLTQIVTPGHVYIIPANNGIVYYLNSGGANQWNVTFHWVEV